ncbi:MAG: radical SAM protein [Clostridiales bacterium]|nr:radical SAM protein [Clostridiales bacterium]
MKKSINILIFKTLNGNSYFYDAYTGGIYPMDDIMQDTLVYIREGYEKKEILNELNKRYEDSVLVEGAVKYIFKLVSMGGIVASENHSGHLTCREAYQNVIEYGGMFQLILNLTENCNMRCKYCYLSTVYEFSRNRTYNKMSFETAKKSMDNFFASIAKIKKTIPGKKCAITFYGGEILMEKTLLKDCIEYAKENAPADVIFSITTNGTLLDQEIADYLVDNNVYIGVSLDGNKVNHDRNRVFTNGNGSFDIVVKNLKDFSKRHSGYNNISILMVNDFKTNLKDNLIFFEENKDLPRISFMTMVADYNTDYYKQFTQDDIERYAKDYYDLLSDYVRKRSENKYIEKYLIALFEMPMTETMIRPRINDDRPDFLRYTGACIPGSKVSVRATGELDMCERVNPNFSIGQYDRWLDYNKIAHIVNDFTSAVTEDCWKCPLNKKCPICFAQCCKDGAFENYNCSGLINSFIEKLSTMYSVLENNRSAYDDLVAPIELLLNN